MQSVLIVIHILIVVALIAVVLLQRSEGGALGAGGGTGSFMTGRGQANALSRAMADGSARPAEEAAALAAMVTVPMRLAGSPGWAAVKTAAFGGRVLASRTRLSPEQIEALWKPIQPAIPLVSLGTPAKTRR